jgi:hypothetical protein
VRNISNIYLKNITLKRVKPSMPLILALGRLRPPKFKPNLVYVTSAGPVWDI